jgi:hypothetical protein
MADSLFHQNPHRDQPGATSPDHAPERADGRPPSGDSAGRDENEDFSHIRFAQTIIMF